MESKATSQKLKISEDAQKTLQQQNHHLTMTNEELNATIDTMEQNHQDEVHTLNNRLRAHEMKIVSLSERLKKIEDGSTYGWFSLLSKYALSA